MGTQVVATVSHRTVGCGVGLWVRQEGGLSGHVLWLLSHTEGWVVGWGCGSGRKEGCGVMCCGYCLTQKGGLWGGVVGEAGWRVVGSCVVATASRRTVSHGIRFRFGFGFKFYHGFNLNVLAFVAAAFYVGTMYRISHMSTQY